MEFDEHREWMQNSLRDKMEEAYTRGGGLMHL